MTVVVDKAFAVTIERILELLELEEEDDYGILKPTEYAFKTAIKLVLEAYKLMEIEFPQASACTEDEGGIRLTWSSRDEERKVCLFCQNNSEQPVDIYHSTRDDYGVVDLVFVLTLINWLKWFNEA